MLFLARRRHRSSGRSAAAADEGLTLVEMMVALGIITGSLLALLTGFITSSASIQSQQERARATRVSLDMHEKLRLLPYDEISVLPATENDVIASGGLQVKVKTVVQDRFVTEDPTVQGRAVKELVTTARWTGRQGVQRSVVYTTAIAQEASKANAPSGYEKAIKSMTISPDPSASVDYYGYTSTPIVITLVMTGHDVSDTVLIVWDDESATGRRVTASTTEGRNWTATIPAGTAGIKAVLAQNQRRDLSFRASTTTGLTTQSSLAVWGPVLNPPVIEPFTVSPNPVKVSKNGKNRYQNVADVTASCTVDRLDVSAGSKDSVKLTYIGEDGTLVEQPLTRTGVVGSRVTFAHTFERSQWYFGLGTNLQWTCVVTRFSDGGPASKVVPVTVGL